MTGTFKSERAEVLRLAVGLSLGLNSDSGRVYITSLFGGGVVRSAVVV
jgi:hypothetical protein